MLRWSVLLLLGCSAKTPPAPSGELEATVTPPAQEAVLDLPAPESSPETVAQMHAWLQLAEQARVELTRGDLAAAKAAGASMAAAPPVDTLPSGWRPFAADLLAEAASLAEANSASSAGAQVGQMGVACGTCHTEAGVLERVALAALPAEMDNDDARMDNHKWASDWMWFGLVTADDSFYRLGATVFGDTSLPAPPPQLEQQEADSRLVALRAVAEAATAATSAPDRAQHYGEILATCATCHGEELAP